MIKGTTPTHTFTLPFGTDMIKSVQIIYAQNDVPVLTKGSGDCTMEGNTISVRLNQEDTFLFAEGSCVEIQVRVLTLGGDSLASNIMRVRCEECLFEGVLE